MQRWESDKPTVDMDWYVDQLISLILTSSPMHDHIMVKILDSIMLESMTMLHIGLNYHAVLLQRSKWQSIFPYFLFPWNTPCNDNYTYINKEKHLNNLIPPSKMRQISRFHIPEQMLFFLLILFFCLHMWRLRCGLRYCGPVWLETGVPLQLTPQSQFQLFHGPKVFQH